MSNGETQGMNPDWESWTMGGLEYRDKEILPWIAFSYWDKIVHNKAPGSEVPPPSPGEQLALRPELKRQNTLRSQHQGAPEGMLWPPCTAQLLTWDPEGLGASPGPAIHQLWDRFQLFLVTHKKFTPPHPALLVACKNWKQRNMKGPFQSLKAIERSVVTITSQAWCNHFLSFFRPNSCRYLLCPVVHFNCDVLSVEPFELLRRAEIILRCSTFPWANRVTEDVTPLICFNWEIDHHRQLETQPHCPEWVSVLAEQAPAVCRVLQGRGSEAFIQPRTPALSQGQQSRVDSGKGATPLVGVQKERAELVDMCHKEFNSVPRELPFGHVQDAGVAGNSWIYSNTAPSPLLYDVLGVRWPGSWIRWCARALPTLRIWAIFCLVMNLD